MVVASIGIGSNIGDAPGNVHTAIELLACQGRLLARSDLYRTKPWGVLDQPDFYNAAALLEVNISPQALLSELKAIERRLGRTPTYRWGPRLIDLDLLTFANLQTHETHLVIPHRHLMERAFVLAPLAEVDPSFAEAFASLPSSAKAEIERIANSCGNMPPYITDQERKTGYLNKGLELIMQPWFDILSKLIERKKSSQEDEICVVDLSVNNSNMSSMLEHDCQVKVANINVSDVMLPPKTVQATADNIEWVQAALPEYMPKQYQLALAVFCLHYLSSTQRKEVFQHVAEAKAELAILTFDHRFFVEHPFAQDFANFLNLELSRFPSTAKLSDELKQSGFTSIKVANIAYNTLGSYLQAAQYVEDNFISTFSLLEPANVKEGITKLCKRSKDGQPWSYCEQATFILASDKEID